MNRHAIVLAIAAAALVAASVAPANALSIKPPKRAAATPSTYSCGGDLGLLRRVLPEQIDAVFDERQVTVIPVCDGEDAALRNEGNAGAIRSHIAMNDAMVIALGEDAYTAEDVVGVRMLGDKVVLYVHESNY
jgi:hypothetical protein